MNPTRRVEIGPATLILGDWREVQEPDWKDFAVVSDPPYGMKWKPGKKYHRPDGTIRSMPWKPIIGDDKLFDPSPWIGRKEVILWGSNHYAAGLPRGATLVWVKKNPPAFGKFLSDAEIAWKKGGNGVWCFHEPGGNFRRRREGLGRVRHPTQKPEALMEWCIRRWTKAETILDPYMGSGTTGVAALRAGRRFVGVELVEEYFEAAVERVTAAWEAMA